jgi:DNA/RNA-binding domain of Phe-tRNA-synthetase-like protein
LPWSPAEALDRSREDLKAAAVAQAYRSWFWSLDVDPTKRRPAGEALGRRLAADGLPTIYPLVDAYNQASAVSLVPLSAFDRDALVGDVRLDLPDPDEHLDALGENEPVDPTGRHPVWRDERGPIGLAAYRDARRTALGEGTTRALVVTVAAGGSRSRRRGRLRATGGQRRGGRLAAGRRRRGDRGRLSRLKGSSDRTRWPPGPRPGRPSGCARPGSG